MNNLTSVLKFVMVNYKYYTITQEKKRKRGEFELEIKFHGNLMI